MTSSSTTTFEFTTATQIVFGEGALERLRELVEPLGRRPLLVLGGRSADESGLRERLERLLPAAAGARCAREPTVEDVDRTVATAKSASCDLVVAVGGGSVLDCGKAAAGMITNGGSLRDYLEGMGTGRTITAPPVPMIAVPTTAGTGSEVTKNAVISGPGYKRSVRSPMLIPRLALVDPQLTRGAPPAVTAACGMDALTQLVEAFFSRGATPLTDGLALQGIEAAGRSLAAVVADGGDGPSRGDMALASLLGGVCLANAGLGAVHGLAASLGAVCGIAHGVACAALLPQVARANLRSVVGTPLEERLWSRGVRLAEALTGRRFVDRASAVDAALTMLHRLQRELCIPRLGALGVTDDRIDEIVAGSRGSSMRYNPVELDDDQLTEILRQAI
jgi:alcohol dehydrogenase class IV